MQITVGVERGSGGTQLHTIEWTPDSGNELRADIVLVHGYGEHSGRYAHVAEVLTNAGYRVRALDHRGHGRSKGVRRGDIDSFLAIVDDLSLFVSNGHSDLPLFIYGHSMGALATVRLAERGDSKFAGLILTGAALVTADSIPRPLMAAANILGQVAPRLRTIALDGNAVSRDQSVRDDYDADPLNFRGKLTARTGREMSLAMSAAMTDAGLIHAPMLIMHGSEDTLAAPSGSRQLSDAVASEDVTYKEWPGAFHELHNEPERQDVLSTIVSWIEHHITEPPSGRGGHHPPGDADTGRSTVSSTVTASICVSPCADAIDFYVSAFGAEEIEPRMTGPDGLVAHAEIRIGNSRVMLGDEWPDSPVKCPTTLDGSSTAALFIDTDDVESLWKRAIDAGAEVVYPLKVQFYGAKGGRLKDPFGQTWGLSQQVEDVPPEEMERRIAAFYDDADG